jgi:glycosyltransferase involved in cell wall biosynthesis
MRIISLHNYYQQPGGEDQLFEDEVKLLESRGHEVIAHTIRSEEIRTIDLPRVAMETVWNRRAYREMGELIERTKPDILHGVNTFPLFSPSVFYAARHAGVPVIATVQNYRYFCAQAMCFRGNSSCDACLGKIPWRAARYGCYRGSRLGSAVVATMQWYHRRQQTWNRCVDVICVASEFSRNTLAAAGIVPERMIIKPNFVPRDPGKMDGTGNYAIFVGRLAHEKGIQTLVDGWHQLHRQGNSIPLKIVGDGPCSSLAEELTSDLPGVQWLGRRSNESVFRLLGDAACLIFPSTGYESLPKTLIESMAVGTPVIGSNIASVPEIVRDRQTGLLFPVGDAAALANAVRQFYSQPDQMAAMRNSCRGLFEQCFTAEANYRQLIEIYQVAMRRRAEASEPAATAVVSPKYIDERGVSSVGKHSKATFDQL